MFVRVCVCVCVCVCVHACMLVCVDFRVCKCVPEDEKTFEDFTVDDLQKWLKPHLEKEEIPVSVLEQIGSQDINGKVFMNMTDADLKEVYSDLKFGPRKKLALIIKQVVQETHSFSEDAKPVLPRQQRRESARRFGYDPKPCEKYNQNKVLNVHEPSTSSSLCGPARQFFPCSDDDERARMYEFIGEKLAIFTAACFNDRKNGTIYFGVGNSDTTDYSYGQILGLPLDKKECEDAVMDSLKKHFAPDTVEAALKCIKVQAFMEVIIIDHEDHNSHFVYEVDIEPRSEVVKDLTLFLNLGSGDQVKKLYRLEDGIPKEQGADQVVKFSNERNELTKERKQQEKSKDSPHVQNLPQVLKDILCHGAEKLDGSCWPLLATGAVDISEADFKESFQFVSNMDWQGILDFDDGREEAGMYSLLDKTEEKLYEVKTADDFCSTSSPDQTGRVLAEEHFKNIYESEVKPWIFCNGYQLNGEEKYNITDWKRKRREGFNKVVQYFRNSIPEGRGVVVILLTSKDDVFIEASEELLLTFQDQWLMIAESKQLADAWIDGLQQRNVEIDRNRCLDGVSFVEVNKVLGQLMGMEMFTKDACVLKSSSGVEHEMPKKMVQELCDLDIVSVGECNTVTGTEVDVLSRTQEEKFYKCNRATWWNFHFKGHVCPRDKLEDLKGKTRQALSGDASDNDNVDFVVVYHQPGSGGTTVAMNVIWDLHKEFKSCTVRRITKDTVRQLLALYEFSDSQCDYRKPVLAMIDDEDEQINELKRNMEEECHNRAIYKLVCVFLVCVRCIALPANHQPKNILLEQKLSPSEKKFFTDKYDELKKRGHANIDHLLGLNIMKEDFNESYMKRTVDCFVSSQTGIARSVLQHTALLNHYDLLFRAIPVSCFDPVMMSQTGRLKRELWENKFKPDPLMLFTTASRLHGRKKCLRITSKLLCRYILDNLGVSKPHEDLMQEFLCSPVFQRRSPDVAVRELLNIVKDCMKKRDVESDGIKRSKFSKFVQMLLNDRKIEEAVSCIHTVFERTGDAFLAQQIARVRIECKNWDEASKWATEAVKKRPDCSFLLDTKGRVVQLRLSEIRAACEESHKPVSPCEIAKAVEYAYEGFQVFVKVQELSVSERYDPPNTSGLFGQMDIVLILCRILQFFPSFSPKSELLCFLSGEKQLPDSLRGTQIQPYHVQWLRSLQEECYNCLQVAESHRMVFSTQGHSFGHTREEFFLSEDNIQRLEDQLNLQFGEDLENLDPEKMTSNQRQRAVRRLGGKSLCNVMNQCRLGKDGRENAKKILLMASLSLKDGRNVKRKNDLSMALAAALTLISHHDDTPEPQKYMDLLRWSKEFFDKTERPDAKQFIHLEPYLYFLVFHWPTPNRQHHQEQCEPAELGKAIERAKEAFEMMHAKKGNAIKKNSPMFFLTKKSSSIVSKGQLQELCGKQREKRVEGLLKHPKASSIVERFRGVLQARGLALKLQLVSPQGNKVELTIPVFIPENKQTMWKKSVFFVLGFGLGGPVACSLSTSSTPSSPCQSDGTSAGSPARQQVSTNELDQRIVQVEHQLQGVYSKKKTRLTQKVSFSGSNLSAASKGFMSERERERESVYVCVCVCVCVCVFLSVCVSVLKGAKGRRGVVTAV